LAQNGYSKMNFLSYQGLMNQIENDNQAPTANVTSHNSDPSPPDFQGPPGAHRTPRDVRCSSSRWTLPPAEPFPGWAGC